MATFRSSQATVINNLITGAATSMNEGGFLNKCSIAYFDYKTPSSSPPGTSDVVELCKLPAGARVMALYVDNEALSSGANTASADIGDASDPDRLQAGGTGTNQLNMDAARGGFVVLRTDNAPAADAKTGVLEPAFGIGYKYTTSTMIIATVAFGGTGTAEAWTTSKQIRGFIVYTEGN